MNDPTLEDRIQLAKTAKTRLIEARELLYLEIDRFNRKIEELDVVVAGLEKKANVSNEFTVLTELELSMRNHPAGKKRRRQ